MSGGHESRRVSGVLFGELVGKIVRVKLIAYARPERRGYPLVGQISPVEAFKERMRFDFDSAMSAAQPLAGHLVQQLEYEILRILGEESWHGRLRLEYPLRYVNRYVLFAFHSERRRACQ